MSQGRISLLIDSPLRDLALALRETPREVKTQISRHTKAEARPIWQGETRERGVTRLQQRALVSSADVSVTARNVTLMAGGKGKLRSGTPVASVARAAEFGMNPTKKITSRSKNGKAYTRRAGNAFGTNRRTGNVVHPAASGAVPRLVSLWVQTAYRTIHEAIEKGT